MAKLIQLPDAFASNFSFQRQAMAADAKSLKSDLFDSEMAGDASVKA
ncbi:MAG: hypothetical protein AAFY73_07980 [Pseudomonadota bacterium]